MDLLENPDGAEEEEEGKEESADEDIPEVVEDDLIKTPGKLSKCECDRLKSFKYNFRLESSQEPKILSDYKQNKQPLLWLHLCSIAITDDLPNKLSYYYAIMLVVYVYIEVSIFSKVQ